MAPYQPLSPAIPPSKSTQAGEITSAWSTGGAFITFDGQRQRSSTGWLRLGRITGNVDVGATRLPVGLSCPARLVAVLLSAQQLLGGIPSCTGLFVRGGSELLAMLGACICLVARLSLNRLLPSCFALGMDCRCGCGATSW